MINQRYRLKRTILALERPDGHAKGFHVPPNEIVTVKGGPLNGERLVDVDLNGRIVMMFTDDLRKHAELLPAQSVNGG